MDIQHVIAKNLRKYRKAAGLSQEKFAEKCGLHRTYIGGIEQERINVSVKNIACIASALGVSPALLLVNSKGIDIKDLLQFKNFNINEQTEEESTIFAACEISGDEVTLHRISKKEYIKALKAGN